MELKKYATVNCIVPVARTRLTTDATPNFAEVMKRLDERGYDVFDPANVSPMVTFLASEGAKKITGEVFRVVADRVYVYQGWTTIKYISNNGKPFTPQILAERVKPELLKDMPKKQTLIDAFSELVKL
jgi:hypothetical protein